HSRYWCRSARLHKRNSGAARSSGWNSFQTSRPLRQVDVRADWGAVPLRTRELQRNRDANRPESGRGERTPRPSRTASANLLPPDSIETATFGRAIPACALLYRQLSARWYESGG